MPKPNQTATRTIAAAFAALTLAAWIAPRLLAGQDAQGTLAVIYGDGSEGVVQDWHFAYEYLESDAPLDPAYVATCPLSSSCRTQLKSSKDLILSGAVPGLSAVGLVPYVLPGGTLRAIRIHWKDVPEERDHLTLKQEPGGDPPESEGITVTTSQGAQIDFEGTLKTPEAFLSTKKYVHFMKLVLTGKAQAPEAPEDFALRLDSRSAPPSLSKRVVEIRFQ